MDDNVTENEEIFELLLSSPTERVTAPAPINVAIVDDCKHTIYLMPHYETLIPQYETHKIIMW